MIVGYRQESSAAALKLQSLFNQSGVLSNQAALFKLTQRLDGLSRTVARFHSDMYSVSCVGTKDYVVEYCCQPKGFKIRRERLVEVMYD